MKSLIVVLSMLVGVSASAGVSDITSCNSPSLDIAVGIKNGSKLLISVTDLGDNTTTYEADLHQFSSKMVRPTLFAFDKMIESHGAIGTGVVLNLDGANSIFAQDGVIYAVTCKDLK